MRQGAGSHLSTDKDCVGVNVTNRNKSQRNATQHNAAPQASPEGPIASRFFRLIIHSCESSIHVTTFNSPPFHQHTHFPILSIYFHHRATNFVSSWSIFLLPRRAAGGTLTTKHHLHSYPITLPPQCITDLPLLNLPKLFKNTAILHRASSQLFPFSL